MALNPILQWIVNKRIQQIILFKKHPIEVQNELLHNLLKNARHTFYGLKYDFKSIKNNKTFRERLPLMDYEDLKPFVDRMKAGEQNLLWPTEINWFAKSSGTTSEKSKYIPVSREALEDCHYKGGKDLLAIHYHQNPDSRLFIGRALVIGGSTQINQFRDDSYSGDLSAIIINNLPFWVEMRRTPDRDIALMSEWENKIDRMARTTMLENVSSVAGVPSWSLVLFKKILEITGKKNILEVWPNLELFMHGGVSMEPYKNQFRKIIGGPINYLESYNASEGYFGIGEGERKNDMLLMLDYGVYYEFIPVDEWDKPNPKTLTLEEVELNKIYAVVITTNAGLWRYKIGDTIKFTCLYPFRFKIIGRTKHFINVFGEELMIDNTEKALAEACKQTKSTISDYTAGPIFMEEGAGAHEWAIEFEKEPENTLIFAEILDNELQKLNSDYEAKRYNNMVLKPIKLNNVPKGTFYAWLKEKGKLGGQNKIPRLSNERTFIDAILKIANHVH